jgi:hypothetical protein
MKAYGEWKYSSNILALGTLCPRTPWDIVPGTNSIGGWVSPRADLDSVGKRKPLMLAGNRTPIPLPSVNSLVDIPTEVSRFIIIIINNNRNLFVFCNSVFDIKTLKV